MSASYYPLLSQSRLAVLLSLPARLTPTGCPRLPLPHGPRPLSTLPPSPPPRPPITGTLKWDPRLGTIPVGAWAELRRLVTPQDVAAYASLLGDDNPLHLDAAFAATTQFKRPIAHGMFSVGLLPTIFGATIPSSVYVSQGFRFLRPVYVGDTVIARVLVKAARVAPAGRGGAQHPFLTCDTSILLEASGKVAVEGEAVVMLPALPAAAAE